MDPGDGCDRSPRAAQHHGLYIERHEHSHMHAVAAGLDAGRERSRQRGLKWSSVAEPSRDYEQDRSPHRHPPEAVRPDQTR